MLRMATRRENTRIGTVHWGFSFARRESEKMYELESPPPPRGAKRRGKNGSEARSGTGNGGNIMKCGAKRRGKKLVSNVLQHCQARANRF